MPRQKGITEGRIRPLLEAGVRPAAIAARLGVNHATVAYWRRRLGLPALRRWWKVDPARVAELHARGMADEAIAAELEAHRCAVTRARRRLGLAAHGKQSVTFAARQREHYRRRTAAAGVRSIRSLNPGSYRRASRELATQYGLPGDLFRTQVLVVLELANGPRTATQLADQVCRGQAGANGYHRFNFTGCPHGNYLTDLRHRGLIAYPPGGGRGKKLYLLTAAALDALAAAPKEDDRGRERPGLAGVPAGGAHRPAAGV